MAMPRVYDASSSVTTSGRAGLSIGSSAGFHVLVEVHTMLIAIHTGACYTHCDGHGCWPSSVKDTLGGGWSYVLRQPGRKRRICTGRS